MEKLDRCALPIATADKQKAPAVFSSARIVAQIVRRYWCQMSKGPPLPTGLADTLHADPHT